MNSKEEKEHFKVPASILPIGLGLTIFGFLVYAAIKNPSSVADMITAIVSLPFSILKAN